MNGQCYERLSYTDTSTLLNRWDSGDERPVILRLSEWERQMNVLYYSGMGTLLRAAIFRGSPTVFQRGGIQRKKNIQRRKKNQIFYFIFLSFSKIFISERIWFLEALAVNQLFALPCSKSSVACVCCMRCVTVRIANLFRYHSRHTRWNMSSVAKMVICGDIFEEIGMQNKWKWEWLSKVVKVGETDEHIGTHFRKTVCGTARCLVCSKDVAYGNRCIENEKKRKKKNLMM